MKKLILPLLLLVAFGMLAAVESDPSAVVGYVKYTTTTGSNIVALPMTNAWTMAGQFGDSFGTGIVSSVSRYNNQTKTFQTANKVGTSWIGNFAIANGNNLRFVASSAVGASFYSIGGLPTVQPSYALYTGINRLMIPLNKSALSTVTLLGNNMGTVNSISRFNNTTKAWQTSNKVGTSWIGSFAVAIGDPFNATATANLTWPARGADLAPLTTSK